MYIVYHASEWHILTVKRFIIHFYSTIYRLTWKGKIKSGEVCFLAFFDFRPFEGLKWPMNTNPSISWDTLYILYLLWISYSNADETQSTFFRRKYGFIFWKIHQNFTIYIFRHLISSLHIQFSLNFFLDILRICHIPES